EPLGGRPPPPQGAGGPPCGPTSHPPAAPPPPGLARGGPDPPPPSDATAVARDWPAAGRPAPARRTPGSDAAARDRREHPHWTVHRPTTPRSSPPTTATDPSGPTASRRRRPRPTLGETHHASRSAATSRRKVSRPGTLPANDAPRAPPSVPARA